MSGNTSVIDSSLTGGLNWLGVRLPMTNHAGQFGRSSTLQPVVNHKFKDNSIATCIPLLNYLHVVNSCACTRTHKCTGKSQHTDA